MKTYFAIVAAQGRYFPYLNKEMPDIRYLLSYYFWRDGEKFKGAYPQPIFADSGGYSARTQGVSLRVEEYADWLETIDYEVAASLDTSDFDESQRNYLYLRKRGIKVLPVIHLEEYVDKSKHKWIDQMIEENDYIAIGGIAGKGVKQRFFEGFFSMIFNKTRDKVKVHGFGATKTTILKKYPFYSVDSNSWNSCERYGYIFQYNNRKMSLDRERLSSGAQGSVIGGKLMWGHLSANQETRMKRIAHNIKQFKLLEEDITKMWKARGVEWK